MSASTIACEPARTWPSRFVALCQSAMPNATTEHQRAGRGPDSSAGTAASTATTTIAVASADPELQRHEQRAARRGVEIERADLRAAAPLRRARAPSRRDERPMPMQERQRRGETGRRPRSAPPRHAARPNARGQQRGAVVEPNRGGDDETARARGVERDQPQRAAGRRRELSRGRSLRACARSRCRRASRRSAAGAAACGRRSRPRARRRGSATAS